jgi:hypothetical protein
MNPLAVAGRHPPVRHPPQNENGQEYIPAHLFIG